MDRIVGSFSDAELIAYFLSVILAHRNTLSMDESVVFK